ncbi:ATP-dependent zinc metalloprotease FtsH [Dokdonella fugitiva]|uniref:ATP-dependent zinc metalloprotease FtsH n=1 Tax=Dokdonella fugitiva TaxID=328517 RepID=A0A4R2ICC9_9GAMM|nr:ATP-dependent zinc metalloprotease FtsH [Dokdonella fugitiva]TCO40225.1 cell division protease FtsH [Dokdonella fugitiva]
MKRQLRFSLWYGIFALIVLVVVERYAVSLVEVETIPYSRFETDLKAGEIEDVIVTEESIRGTYKAHEPAARPRRFEAARVERDIAAELTAAGVSYRGASSSGWFEGILGWLVPPLIFLALWMLFTRHWGAGRGSGLMTIGKSNAKVYLEKSIRTTFADVAGVDDAKAELEEVIAFLRDPEGHGRLGAHVPKGVLLVGPPGTGKTLLARAVAGEAGVPFLSINGSEFVELFVGVGAARVRDLFERAREQAPCIIFIDELDALGRARGSSPVSGGQDEKEQTLNQLLSELDGFDSRSGVVLLAATNRPEILDPALLRAGRFDRQILVDRPDKVGRLAILRVHARKVVLHGSVSLDDVASLTAGFTGADLANLVNEAALLATRRNAAAVEQMDLNEAIERIIAGLEKKTRILSPSERRTIAYHEIGHALVALALPGANRVQKVSIIPRGIAALGYTIQRPLEDRFLMSRGELGDKLAILFGGRAAESIVFGDTSTGAADDLAKATGIARNMVLRYGMVPKIGHVSYDPGASSMLDPASDPWRPRLYGEATAATVDDAVRSLLDAAFERARSILSSERAALDHAATILLERETLSGDELISMLAPSALSPATPSTKV